MTCWPGRTDEAFAGVGVVGRTDGALRPLSTIAAIATRDDAAIDGIGTCWPGRTDGALRSSSATASQEGGPGPLVGPLVGPTTAGPTRHCARLEA